MLPSAYDGNCLHRKSLSHKQNKEVLGRDRDKEISELIILLDVRGKLS